MFWLGELSNPERDLREFHSGVFVKCDSAPRANILEKTGGLLQSRTLKVLPDSSYLLS